jgi:serine/threonine protein kinase/tetratricopeptide (TPR) repeat protein
LIGTKLGPYEITAKLGEGGMGVVFRAKDFHLGREVALKVLPEGFTADPERAARFEREAKLLASLNHPNIAQIYGLETSGDTRALVMELVEGPTLAERLESGSLSLTESLSIARQIAEALEEAHEKGIVHRDLKPQNVKASIEGKVKVLDFGLAKAVDPFSSAAVPAEELSDSPTVTFGGTLEGVILGTAAYMAPEQARGAAVDKRADIWAFGVVLYEMLTGERLFAEASVVDTLSAVMRKEIDLGKLPVETPPRLRELVARCLERDPKLRLRDIGEARLLLAGDLERDSASLPAVPAASQPPPVRSTAFRPRIVIAGLAIALVAAVGWMTLRNRGTSVPKSSPTKIGTAAAAERSIAVLPFQNLSAEAENAFFAAGVHEDVLTHLSRIADLKVISRSSVMQYAAPEKNLREIAADLGVVYVVEGSVRRAADRVRVTAQLIDARSDEHLWAENYDRDLADVFAIQSAIAQEIVTALEATLSPREAEMLASRPTTSIAAYDLFLRARQLMQQRDATEPGEELTRLLEEAIRLDPEFAHAYALLAAVHGQKYWFLVDRSPERLARMKSAIDRAFELRPDLPEARMALAEYFYRGFYDYTRAIEQLELARSSLPNDSFVHYYLGLAFRRVGEVDRSIDSFVAATRLDPASLVAYAEGINTSTSFGRVERGIDLAEEALRRFPRDPRIAGERAKLHLDHFGDIGRARAILDAADAAPNYYYWQAQYFTRLYAREFRRAAEAAAEPSYQEAVARGWGATLAAEALAHGGFHAEATKLLEEAEAVIAGELAKPYAESYGWPHLVHALNLTQQSRTEEALASCDRAIRILSFERDRVHGAAFRQECAWVKAKAGEIEEALAEIELFLDQGYDFTRWQLALDPRWDFLRGDPRFRELSTPKPAEAAK